MNPVTLRRLLVFGVCAVGVGALYLVPALTGPAGVVAAPPPDGEPTSLPTGTADNASGRPGRSVPVPVPSRSSDATTSSAVGTAGASVRASRPARPAGGATAYDPRTSTDHVPPSPVTAITTAAVTRDRLTVSWPPATDDVGVLRYRVVLNGFTVATTRKTHATIRWFNDDLGSHVIQVRALDAAGNESPSSPNLLVSRPTPGPTPSPTPSAPPTEPSPTATPTPTPSAPAPAPTVAPNEAEQPDAVPSASAAAPSATGGN